MLRSQPRTPSSRKRYPPTSEAGSLTAARAVRIVGTVASACLSPFADASTGASVGRGAVVSTEPHAVARPKVRRTAYLDRAGIDRMLIAKKGRQVRAARGNALREHRIRRSSSQTATRRGRRRRGKPYRRSGSQKHAQIRFDRWFDGARQPEEAGSTGRNAGQRGCPGGSTPSNAAIGGGSIPSRDARATLRRGATPSRDSATTDRRGSTPS